MSALHPPAAIAVLVALGGCADPPATHMVPADSAAVPPVDSADTGAAETDPVPVFSFAIIADPHVTGPGEHLDRLHAAVAHLAELHDTEPLAFVAVLGDIAWGGGWEPSRDALQALPVPWVPIQGDNPIQVGEETGFEATFGPQLTRLADQLDGWQRAPLPTPDPIYGEVWLTNFAFEHEGVTFVGLDWNSREVDTIFGETPDLFDLPGGTLPFLEGVLEQVDATPGLDDRVVTLTHMPMMYGPGFYTVDEVEVLEARVGPYGSLLAANHAGHLHGNGETEWAALGLDVVVTDATWDDDNAVRIVRVAQTNQRVVFTHEVVVVPPE